MLSVHLTRLFKISQSKTIFKWEYWSLLVGLWVWPRGSLMTPCLVPDGFHLPFFACFNTTRTGKNHDKTVKKTILILSKIQMQQAFSYCWSTRPTTVPAGSDHYFHTECPFVRPKTSKSNNNHCRPGPWAGQVDHWWLLSCIDCIFSSQSLQQWSYDPIYSEHGTVCNLEEIVDRSKIVELSDRIHCNCGILQNSAEWHSDSGKLCKKSNMDSTYLLRRRSQLHEMSFSVSWFTSDQFKIMYVYNNKIWTCLF